MAQDSIPKSSSSRRRSINRSLHASVAEAQDEDDQKYLERRSKIGEMRQRIAELTYKNSALNTELDQVKAKYQVELENSIEQLKSETVDKKTFEGCLSELNAVSDERQKLQQELETAHKQNQNLEGEVGDLRQCREEKEALEVENTKLFDEISAFQASGEEMKKKLDALESQKRSLLQDLYNERELSDQRGEECDRLRERNEKRDREVENLKAHLREAECELVRLQETYENKLSDYSLLDLQQSQLRAQLNDKAEELEACRKEQHKMEDEKDKDLGTIEELKTTISYLQIEREKDKKVLNDQITALEGTIETLRTERDNEAGKLAIVTQACERSNESLKDKTEELNKRESEIAELHCQISGLEREHEEAKRQLKDTEIRLHNARNTIDEMQLQIDRLDRELREQATIGEYIKSKANSDYVSIQAILGEEKDRHEEAMSELRAGMRVKDERMEDMEKEIDRLKSSERRLIDDIASLQDKYASLRTEHEVCMAELDRSKSGEYMAREDLERMRNKLGDIREQLAHERACRTEELKTNQREREEARLRELHWKAVHEGLEGTLEKLRGKYEAVQEQCESLRHQIRVESSNVGEKALELEDTKRKMESLAIRNAELEKRNNDLYDELREAERRELALDPGQLFKGLQEEKDHHKATIEENQRIVEGLKAELQSRQTVVNDLEERVKALEANKLDLESVIDKHRTEYIALQENNALLTNERDNAEKNEKCERYLVQDLRADIERLKERISDLIDQCALAENEHEKLKRRHLKLQHSHDKLNAKFRDSLSRQTVETLLELYNIYVEKLALVAPFVPRGLKQGLPSKHKMAYFKKSDKGNYWSLHFEQLPLPAYN